MGLKDLVPKTQKRTLECAKTAAKSSLNDDENPLNLVQRLN